MNFPLFFRLRALGLSLAGLWLVLDQLTKHFALKMSYGEVVAVIPDLLNFRLAFNRGVSFSMFADVPHVAMPHILGGGALLVAAWLTWWLGKQAHRPVFVVGVSGLIGGAVGNAIDRFRFGAVVDFIDFYYGKWHFPTFNVADTAITVGVGLIMLDAVLEYRQQQRLEREQS